MENCTIYSHYLKFDKVVEIVKEHLPKAKINTKLNGSQKSLTATIKSGFFGKPKELKINYRERKNPSYTINEIECGLTQNLAGMANFIQTFPVENQQLKHQFLAKVMAANCEMPFMASPSFNEEFRSVLKRIVVELDAFIFAQPGTIFTRSSNQHFVDKHFKLIMDPTGKTEIDSIEVKVDAKYHDGDQNQSTTSQKNRKKASEEYLISNGIKVNKNLPYTPDESQIELRSKAEILYRIYPLLIVAAKGEGVPKANLDNLIEQKNITSFTPIEKAFIHSENLSDLEKSSFTWRYESINVLLWALGMGSLSHPTSMCDAESIIKLLVQNSRETLADTSKIKSTKEILDELDKVYRLNWACVDARLKGEPVTGNVNPSVIYERHYTLNWLTNYQNQRWDNITTDT